MTSSDIIGYAAEDIKSGDYIYFNLEKGGFCKSNGVDEFKNENRVATLIKVGELYNDKQNT